MIIQVACFACKRRENDTSWRTSKQRAGTASRCRMCHGTGQMGVEETLPCAKCRLHGQPARSLVYQDIIGRLVVWRYSFGPDWTKLAVP